MVDAMNHDAMFKSLLKTGRILRDFFEVFLPKVYAFVDFDHIEFVDKERFTIEGKRRTGDLLIKTRFRGEEAAFLIHLEHEAQARPNLARRMLEYFLLDWRDFNLPVYPIIVLSHPTRNPQVRSPLRLQIRDEEILSFRFAVIDLGGFDAREYADKRNAAALALSSRMRVTAAERVALAVDFIRNAARAGWAESELDVTSRFFFAYQEFRGEEGLKLERELSTIEDMKISKEILARNPLVQFGMKKGLREGLNKGLREGLNKGLREGLNKGLHKGLHKGLREGVREGRRQEGAELVLRQLTRRVGKIPPARQKAIRGLDLALIENLAEALLDFQCEADLARWLKSHPA